MREDINREDKTQEVVILAPGTEVFQYRLIRQLGVGGMGEVYLARDTNLNRQVALKFLAPQLALDNTFRERFLREARTAAAINHPNIVTVYDVAEFQERVYISLEYIEGVSLKELIGTPSIDFDKCLDIAVQICNGLAVAHDARLIHRDIKPDNIFVDKNGRVRILDFGLARAENDMRLTLAGQTMGTVNYMSPEQGLGKDLDQRSDIFSLGVVLYEVFTGKLPFKAGNLPATLHSIINDDPAPLRTHGNNLPAKMQKIMDNALAKEPEARYQSVKDLKADLVAIRDSGRSHSGIMSGKPPIKPELKSLAVLYLRNLGNPDDEYLSYGITEDLIVDLTRVGSVRVASMRSILKYKDTNAELEDIARNLKADLILDGSIRKSEDSLRISAQLIEVYTGENVWAERWEEPTDNLPHIKKALTDAIVRALNLGKTTIVQAQIAMPGVGNAEAYENYLKAKYSFEHKQNRSDIDIALGLYSLALKEEPGLLAARAGIAEIMIYNGDYSSAEIELDSALKEATTRGLKADQANILRLLAGLKAKQSKWDMAREYADRALDLNKEMGDLAGEAATLGVLIAIYQPQAKFEEVIVLFDRVLEISRQLDDPERIAEALKNMGIAYARKGDYDRALSLYDECLELSEKTENISLEASCYANIGNVYYFQGQYEQAYDKYGEALTISEKIGDKGLAARQKLNMGLIDLQTGRFKEGLPLLDGAAKIFDDLGDRSNFALALVNKSQANLTLGDFEQAVAAAQKGLELAQDIDNPLVKSDALIQLGSAYFFSREIETAVEYYQQALEIAEKANISRNVAHIHLALVNICYYCKDFDKCKQHASKALSIAREIGEKTALIMSNAGLGAVEACQGLFNTGLRQLEDAYHGIKRIGNKQMLIHLKALLGEVLLKHGKSDRDHDQGRIMLEEALTMAQEFRLAPETKLIREILAR